MRPDGLVTAATYDVWDLYQNHTGSTPLSATVTAPARTTQLRLSDDRLADGTFRTRPVAVDLLDVSPSISEDRGTLHVAVINRSATEAIPATLQFDGAAPPDTALGRTIGAEATELFASNSISDPAAVTLSEAITTTLRNGSHTFPPHSVTLLDFSLDETSR